MREFVRDSHVALAAFDRPLGPLAKPVITAPIVGATKLHHLDEALASVNVKLSAEEIASLEEPYMPHQVVGFL